LRDWVENSVTRTRVVNGELGVFTYQAQLSGFPAIEVLSANPAPTDLFIELVEPAVNRRFRGAGVDKVIGDILQGPGVDGVGIGVKLVRLQFQLPVLGAVEVLTEAIIGDGKCAPEPPLSSARP
jgi:hypothetical protein